MRVEIAPGRVCEVSMPKPPTHVLARLVPIQGQPGTMRAVPMEWTPVITLRRGELMRHGIYIQVHILRKLVKAGLVKGSLATPKQSVIDLASLHTHLERTRCDGEAGTSFWNETTKGAYANAFEPLARDEE